MEVDLNSGAPVDRSTIAPSDNRTNGNSIPIPSSESPLDSLISDMASLMPSSLAEVETAPPSKWTPQKLIPRHREIMRRIVEGATYQEISEEMGISPPSIYIIANSAIFKEELLVLEAQADFNVIKRADALSGEALDTLKNLMRKARTESVRYASASGILDRAGYSKIEKKVIASVSGEEVIRELNRRRREDSNSNGHETVERGEERAPVSNLDSGPGNTPSPEVEVKANS